jgi:hypothetical protein
MKQLAFSSVLLFALAASIPAVERLGFHEIQTDTAGRIVPWCSPQPSTAYDSIIARVWTFWKCMGNCSNGIPYFYQHQVWKPEHDPRGLGGDQLAMALSSLNLLYGYTGDREVLDYMTRIADFVLAHGLSSPTDAWPNLPYPYNTDLHSGTYDGDMRAGKGILQPDKAASFAAELLTLYEMTGHTRYLSAATAIADTLASKIVSGDTEHSPWPFRVNARTGELATQAVATYTANWTGALRLFDGLVQLRAANRAAYESARTTLIAWIKEYPLRTNKWGPFFEDITGWSDTEINADTMAWYILEHRGKDAFHDAPNHSIARCVLDWTLTTFGTNYWSKYGVTAIQEQTAYRVPGNSHTSRHASVELLYAEKSGDTLRKEDAIRQLNWATYMVDDDGKNRYPNDDIWLTDGYGDYLRHYLRAMAAAPELAPEAQDHLLRSSSTIQQIAYASASITYTTFDQPSRERLRISFAPREVRAGNRKLKRLKELQDLERNEGYYFEAAGPRKGLLEIGHSKTGAVVITK